MKRNQRQAKLHIDELRRIIHTRKTLFSGWDEVRPTKDCLHCKGSGLAPSTDNRTPCGFCKGAT